MTARRGIFFTSKSRPIESTVLVEEKNRSPTKIDATTILNNDDLSSSASSNSQTSPPKLPASTTAAPSGVVKKKLILKNKNRLNPKTIYSGPRKIFSTSYKVIHQHLIDKFKIDEFQANRAQLNHRAFFGGEADEFEYDEKNPPDNNVPMAAKGAVLIKSKSGDQLRPTTTTIIENGKTKIVCPRDQKKVFFFDSLKYF